jgi:hypothetical protein
MPPRSLFHVAPWLISIIVAGHALAQTAEAPVMLPQMTVQANALPVKKETWRYARVEGFEVLSNASDGAARDLLRDFLRFRQALVLAWPPADLHLASPASLVLCGKDGNFGAFLPKDRNGPDSGIASLTLRRSDMAAIVVDLAARTLSIANADTLGDAAASAAAANAADAAAQIAVATQGGNNVAAAPPGPFDPQVGSIPQFLIDTNRQLYREYLHFVLSHAEPAPPPWLEEGLAQIFMRIDISDRGLVVGKLAEPDEKSALANTVEEQDFNVTLNHRSLMPLSEMFAVAADSAIALHPVGSLWSAQCYAFVHYGLYGEKGRHQQAFMNFIGRAAREPVTEKIFKDCFKEDYKSMLLDLRGYIQYTTYKSTEMRLPQRQKLPAVADILFREATPAEIGRIKGEALFMAGNRVAAGETLLNAFRLGERDPQLLAALGLYENAIDDPAAAERYLENATAADVIRPRAYLELAQLHLAAELAAPKAPEGRLSPEQLAEVLRLLFVARAQPPPMPEVYEAIAAAWSHSAVPPTKANLAVLDEGLRIFYRHSDFLYQTAQLELQYGFKTSAAELADIGIRLAQDEATKQRFIALRANLLPGAPGAAAGGKNP